MLLPDQTYADYNVGSHRHRSIHLTASQEIFHKPRTRTRTRSPNRTKIKPRSKSSTSTSSYDRTADFFENIPDFLGTTLPAFLYSPAEEAAAEISQKEVLDQSDASSSKSENCDNDDVLRLCEDFLCRHRMRPDFFCQYHKAVSSATPSPKQRKASPAAENKPNPSPAIDAELKISKDQNIIASSSSPSAASPTANKISAAVEHFTKFSAIYTLPVAKRKKAGNKTGNITGKPTVNTLRTWPSTT
ncbi:uncharacterized protein [Drosophila tropicalis]|uniref:uncharacterized protein n=1 Tax=Drosophila tropicalis TaxID=46794 RepID=UPI0035ABF6CB